MTMIRAAIRAEKLSKTFSSGGVQQHVLKNVDLTIHDGEFVVIMGPSGSGKSTLLYALSGMDRPTLGKVYLDDEEISGYSENKLATFRREHCGFVFQQIHLLDSMSVLDNIMAVGLLRSDDRHEVAARAHELFDLVGIEESTRTKLPAQISGGEAQRSAIVRALINEPSVIFADEPTGQLNSELGQMVLDLLSTLHERQQTIVLVTHDLRTALRGSRILYLRDGAIRGELRLGGYDSDEAGRQDKLTAFLTQMGW